MLAFGDQEEDHRDLVLGEPQVEGPVQAVYGSGRASSGRWPCTWYCHATFCCTRSEPRSSSGSLVLRTSCCWVFLIDGRHAQDDDEPTQKDVCGLQRSAQSRFRDDFAHDRALRVQDVVCHRAHGVGSLVLEIEMVFERNHVPVHEHEHDEQREVVREHVAEKVVADYQGGTSIDSLDDILWHGGAYNAPINFFRGIPV